MLQPWCLKSECESENFDWMLLKTLVTCISLQALQPAVKTRRQPGERCPVCCHRELPWKTQQLPSRVSKWVLFPLLAKLQSQVLGESSSAKPQLQDRIPRRHLKAGLPPAGRRSDICFLSFQYLHNPGKVTEHYFRSKTCYLLGQQGNDGHFRGTSKWVLCQQCPQSTKNTTEYPVYLGCVVIEIAATIRVKSPESLLHHVWLPNNKPSSKCFFSF